MLQYFIHTYKYVNSCISRHFERWFAGTRFQTAGHTGAEEDVATEYEDQAHRSGHNHRAHPHHHPVRVPWLQLQQVRIWLEMAFCFALSIVRPTSSERRPCGFWSVYYS